jgi:hypothetical protein
MYVRDNGYEALDRDGAEIGSGSVVERYRNAIAYELAHEDVGSRTLALNDDGVAAAVVAAEP